MKPVRVVQRGRLWWTVWVTEYGYSGDHWCSGWTRRDCLREERRYRKEQEALRECKDRVGQTLAALPAQMERVGDQFAAAARSMAEFAATLDPIAINNAAQPECPIGWNGEQVR